MLITQLQHFYSGCTIFRISDESFIIKHSIARFINWNLEDIYKIYYNVTTNSLEVSAKAFTKKAKEKIWYWL